MALVVYIQENPERWHKIAKAIEEKDEEDVKRHYELLVKDVRDIESGIVRLCRCQSIRKLDEASVASMEDEHVQLSHSSLSILPK
ncbi:hypothetical protein QQ045_027549 [Rhodiola kirilowii]